MALRLRIVVADEAEARFYDATGPQSALQLVREMADPAAHLHDRDLKSDRPGRVFDHAPAAGQRHGSVAHHGTGGERRPRRHEARRFAREIAHELDETRKNDQFDRLVLMAGPPFLGMLRATLSKPVQAVLAAEVPKDLVHQDVDIVRGHLPQGVFTVPRRVG
jgi:protein required for attachment to host cells